MLASALEYAPRLGDQFATRLLERVDRLLDDCEDTIEKALLIQRALYVAAHFGHTKRVNALVVRLRNELPAIVDFYLQAVVQHKSGDDNPIETVETLLLHSFRGLRKLGMRDELSALYGRVAELCRTTPDAQVGERFGISAVACHCFLCVAVATISSATLWRAPGGG